MNNILLNKFLQAITWNTLLYLLLKLLNTGEMLILYKILLPEAFSTWAAITSFIYLSALWTDLGFRKSIAQFWPDFNHTRKQATTFIIRIFILQIIMLMFSLPVFVYLFMRITSFLSSDICIIACILYITQSLTALTQHIYHAHFLNKFYNRIIGHVLCLETLINFTLMYFLTPNIQLVTYILLTKCVLKFLFFNYIALHIPSKILPKKSTSLAKKPSPTYTKFITYSGTMWSTTILKSLTERNILFLFITSVAGPIAGNTFKITNDLAVVFYRFVLKSIGSADTAYLAHAHNANNSQAFVHLKKVMLIMGLAILVCIFITISIGVFLHIKPNYIILFGIMACSYILETMLMPYERFLEVQRQYKKLLVSYVPYILVSLFASMLFIYSMHSLILFLLLIHVSRLMSLFCIRYYVTEEKTHLRMQDMQKTINPQCNKSMRPKQRVKLSFYKKINIPHENIST